ncbi:MAG TPA: nuclear transport factor 2 family protein, partial [Azospira sp.]|nr:nuclear transport factor 2 family protein [Azospira sp.]
PRPRGPVQVTNVFIRGADGWRLLSHHASMGAEDSDSGAEARHDGPPRVLH